MYKITYKITNKIILLSIVVSTLTTLGLLTYSTNSYLSFALLIAAVLIGLINMIYAVFKFHYS
ncbi:hypothetical protein AwDysgo_20640 [Bacteroidales bacterium]|nr:hypothetical protein AwDysgo_20640 [Bacteroidales bacterium]